MQLEFQFQGRRFEIPFAATSWRDGEIIKRVEVGAHSVDLDWPWWRPWDVKELAR